MLLHRWVKSQRKEGDNDMNGRFKDRWTKRPGLARFRALLSMVNERSRRVWQEMKNITPWGLR